MFENLYKKYQGADVVGKFIFVNVALYVLLLFIGVFSVLFNAGTLSADVLSFVELPASLELLLVRPWTVFTYMFIHAGLWHILWNMFALYFFGRIFLNFYSVRHFVGIYILGGLFGALFFVLAYNLFPYFGPYLPFSRLVGASAAVLAIVVAAAVRSPQYRINLMFVGSVKLSTFALVVVAMSFLMLSGENAGGNFAHLGGAFAGWLVADMLNKGKDLTLVVNGPIDWMSSLLTRLRTPRKKKTKYTYTRGGRSADYEYNARKKADEAEVDRILEKVKKGGYASLSEEEKRRLFEASSK
ncbi:MAG: rhomboid family intramembrane serine protease [Bacteroidales bacterium]|nr:rhomboid family intramembrane serine protease [Bacteroidales bacterium]